MWVTPHRELVKGGTSGNGRKKTEKHKERESNTVTCRAERCFPCNAKDAKEENLTVERYNT